MARVEELLLARAAGDVVERGGQVVLGDVVEREAPVLEVIVRIECSVRSTVRVATHVADPHVEARVRQEKLNSKAEPIRDYVRQKLFSVPTIHIPLSFGVAG